LDLTKPQFWKDWFSPGRGFGKIGFLHDPHFEIGQEFKPPFGKTGFNQNVNPKESPSSGKTRFKLTNLERQDHAKTQGFQKLKLER